MKISSDEHHPEQTFSLEGKESSRTVAWSDPASFLQKIYVEEDVTDLPYTKRILNKLGDIPVQTLPVRTHPDGLDTLTPATMREGKKTLLLARNRGKFLKSCPGTREYRCCDYQVLNVGMNCPMDCVYCILQAYLNNPWLSVFVNVDDLLVEVAAELDADPNRFWRIGTGEFTDSMALDRITGLSRILIEFIASRNNAVLELKTKAACLEHVRDADHGGRTIMAWSLNSPRIVAAEELRTASLAQRLATAAQCAEWGYRLAFHFDPIIYHPGWQEGYAETIDLLFSSVPKESIAWISMGALRFLPQLRKVALARFPGSRFFHEEFVIGLDGKCRYFRDLRTEMYRFLADRILSHAAPSSCLYLCMESDEIWRDVFGFTPPDRGGLGVMLDNAARGTYG